MTDTKKSYPKWHNSVAGGIAGAGARFFTAPLDLLKIRLQLQRTSSSSTSIATPAAPSSTSVVPPSLRIYSSLRDIAQSEGGIKSLFRGNVAATYLWISYAVIQFSLYGRTSDLLKSYGGTPPPPPLSDKNNHVPWQQQLRTTQQNILHHIGSHPTSIAFVSGATAGVCATLATYPFDICRTTFAARGLQQRQQQHHLLQQQQPKPPPINLPSWKQTPPETIHEFLTSMLRSRGIGGLYAGVTPALLQIIPYMGINFALYEYFVMRLEQNSTNKNKQQKMGMAGTLSGAISKFMVYPLDTTKKRLQSQSFRNVVLGTVHVDGAPSIRYRGTLDCLWKVGSEEGLGALYRGWVPSILKNGMATGLTFLFYGWSLSLLEGLHRGGGDDHDGHG